MPHKLCPDQVIASDAFAAFQAATFPYSAHRVSTATENVVLSDALPEIDTGGPKRRDHRFLP